MTRLILRLADIDISTKKKSSKKVIIGSDGPSNLKIILLLLTKMVTIYVRLIIIYV